jgi:predicted enzyme related to lactoylglutathione lyase
MVEKIYNAVGWFELYVNDLAPARAFYTAVFNREMQDLPMPEGDMQMRTFTGLDDAPGAAGAFVKSPRMGPGVGGTLVYFSCADCAEEAARAQAAAGKVMQPKTSIIGQYGFIALVQDTEGNLIGLHSLQRVRTRAPRRHTHIHAGPRGRVAAELHREGGPSLRECPQRSGVAQHFGQRYLSAQRLAATAGNGVHALEAASPPSDFRPAQTRKAKQLSKHAHRHASSAKSHENCANLASR